MSQDEQHSGTPGDPPGGPEPVRPEGSPQPPVPGERADDEPAAAQPGDGEPIDGEPVDGEPVDGEPGSDEPGDSGLSDGEPGDSGLAAGEPGDGEPDTGGPAARGSGGGARPRQVTAAGAFIGVLLALLGFALVVQLRSNAGDAQLANERPEDLVQILSDLDSRQEQLRLEIAQLQSTKQQLEAGSQGRDAALAAATQRANELGILAGTLAAQGPGIVVAIRAGGSPVKASVILDMVEELRDAGAEAMQINGANGRSVRIVASSYFVDGADGQLNADGQLLSTPFTITAIGDPQTLQPALNIAGGVVDAVHQAGGTVSVTTPGTVTVSTTVTATQPRYAEPVN